ncbi:unnamed protein product [Linum tenue]|uniref:Cytochrome P450 n=1 Tax=Linum tenue TaxID=586396 RepID=A0AAV0M3U2_9ROSI|nr:unnamed protein product [Linum tenue]
MCLLITILGIVFGTRVTRRRKKRASSRNSPPGPRRLPIIGNLHQLVLLGGQLPLHQRLRELARAHGPVMRLQLGQLRHVVVTSAEAAEQVMRTHDLAFASRPSSLVLEILTYGRRDLAFAPYGDHWRRMRKLCVVELLSARRVLSFRPHRMEEASKLVAAISRSSSHEGVRLKPILGTFANAVVCRAAFGKPLKLVALLDDAMVTAGGFRLSDVFPGLEFLAVVSGYRSKIEAHHRLLDSLLDEVINDHMAKRRTNSTAKATDGDQTTEDLVDVLLNLQQNADPASPITMEAVKAVLQDMFLAGTDTTTRTIEWAMAEMMKNPSAMQKAQTEDAVIKETLRLHPPGPFLIPRESREEANVGGFDIPVRSQVLVNVWAIGRDPRYWNEADKFSPERFLNSTTDYRGAHFQFLPFGAGRRMCPGIQFGMVVVQLALANLLFHFDWKLPNEMKPEDLDLTEEFSDNALKMRETLLLIPVARRIGSP